MSIPGMPATPGDLQELIRQGENARVEFKEELSSDVLKGLDTDIAALANFQGGTIVFGITDDRVPVGCVLQKEERERVSDQALRCSPSVHIELGEIEFGEMKFLIVGIERSTIIHNDHQHRFPVRIGDKTGFLEAAGLIALLQERRLISAEATAQVPPPSERKREPIPDSEVPLLERTLSSTDSPLRLEALRDINNLTQRSILLDRGRISTFLARLLKSGSSEEVGLVLDILRTIVLRGESSEMEVITPWMELVVEKGKAVNEAEIARKAFDVLQYAKNEGAADVLIHWVKSAEDDAFNSFNPRNLLANIRFYGLDQKIREAMYSILESDADANVRERASTILDAVRNAYG